MKYILLTIASLAIITTSLNAQTKTKFGHIDSQALLEAMPEKAAADKKLEEFAATLEKQLGAMSSEWEAKVQDYRANEAVMSDIIAQTKAEEMTAIK